MRKEERRERETEGREHTLGLRYRNLPAPSWDSIFLMVKHRHWNSSDPEQTWVKTVFLCLLSWCAEDGTKALTTKL